MAVKYILVQRSNPIKPEESPKWYDAWTGDEEIKKIINKTAESEKPSTE
jgi:hypothetical protein